MLRLFFNRNSLFVRFAFWGAFGLTLVFFLDLGWVVLDGVQRILWLACLVQISFAKAVELYPWYPKENPGPGIRLQFQKAMVPVSYLWLSLTILLWWKPLTAFLLLYNALLFPMGAVACILIYFHRKDPERKSPNSLSGLDPHPPLPSGMRVASSQKEPSPGLPFPNLSLPVKGSKNGQN
jgi:hypothetical protein